MIIQLVRHGTSLANTGELDPLQIGDYRIPLSELGREQARRTGAALGADFLQSALIYTSPYLRARQTLDMLAEGAGLEGASRASLKVNEDPRLREVERGYTAVERQQELRTIHDWFYYRYAGGESPADCYDRTSGFLDGMMRQVERKRLRGVL